MCKCKIGDILCVEDKYGEGHFVDNYCQAVILSIAKDGNDSQRDRLINHPWWKVRAAIARYGNNHHRDQLLNDKHKLVRLTVAQYGDNFHRYTLIKDVDVDVQRYAIKHYTGSID